MTTGSQEYIRALNRDIVLKSIVKNAPISRAELSKKVNLTKATVSSIVQELLDEHLLLEIGSAKTSLGRKPILLTFHQTCGYVVSLDIGDSSTTVLVSDLKGENCQLKEYRRNTDHISFAELSQILGWTIRGLKPTPYGVIGICLGIHGVVNENQILFTPYYQVEENICQKLSAEFQVPVFAENEANLCVLGESYYHYKENNIIHINVHAGIGVGILIGKELYKGKQGYAGEFGHTVLFPGGRPCPCGNKGCLEQYASEKAILDTYASIQRLSRVTIEKFIRDYNNEEPLALKMMEDFAFYMSICINNILNTFDPELIIINSSFTNYLPNLLEDIRSRLKNTGQKNAVRMLVGEMQDLSELLGGVSICTERFLYGHS